MEMTYLSKTIGNETGLEYLLRNIKRGQHHKSVSVKNFCNDIIHSIAVDGDSEVYIRNRLYAAITVKHMPSATCINKKYARQRIAVRQRMKNMRELRTFASNLLNNYHSYF